jgi:hypothetical protein
VVIQILASLLKERHAERNVHPRYLFLPRSPDFFVSSTSSSFSART